MKLVQLNIWGGRLTKNIIDLLSTEDPDIVCMQEVFKSDGDIGLLMGTLSDIQESLNYEYVFYSPVFQFEVMKTPTQFGNCILSKYPFKKQETIFTHLEYVDNFSFQSHSYNARNLQHAVINVENRDLNVLNHHGYHVPSHKNGDPETLRQMKQIGEYLDGLKGPIILTGDFNLAPNSESLNIINDRLDNLSVRYGLKTTRTPLTHKTEVCDYIFINNSVEAKSFSAPPDLVSDHRALIFNFEV